MHNDIPSCLWTNPYILHIFKNLSHGANASALGFALHEAC